MNASSELVMKMKEAYSSWGNLQNIQTSLKTDAWKYFS
jgi:hypothetical protein